MTVLRSEMAAIIYRFESGRKAITISEQVRLVYVMSQNADDPSVSGSCGAEHPFYREKERLL